MTDATGIALFVATLETEKLLKLRTELGEKLVTNARHISLSMGGKSVAQTELVDSGLLMGIVARELRRRGIVEGIPQCRRTVARFI